MYFVIIVTYFVLLLVIRSFVKDRISKLLILIYSSYWFASLLLCKINPFGYYEVSERTYILLIAHVITFVLGYILINPQKKKTIIRSKGLGVSSILSNIFFISFFILCFLFILVLFNRQRTMLAMYNLHDVRGDFMDMILEGSGLAYLFYNIPATGMFHFSLCLLMFLIFFNNKEFNLLNDKQSSLKKKGRGWVYVLFLSAYIVVFAIIGGGRNQFMTLAYYVIGTLILSDQIMSAKAGRNKKYVIPRKIKIVSPFVVLGLVVAMSLVSALRSGQTTIDKKAFSDGLEELGMTLGEYSAGPIVAFDIGLSDNTFNSKQKFWGTATFSGFDYVFYIIFRRFGIHEKTSYDETTSSLQNDYIHIAPDRGWNYAFTSCMYYYFDFGIAGIIFMPFILGIIVRSLIKRLYYSLNIYDIALFIYICVCMFMSVFSGYLHKIVSLLYMFLLYLLSNYKKVTK